jgi:predicted enzyme related to lactoylglutathione lyase
MITAVTHITRYVRNEDEALAYYRDVLGFEVHTDTAMGPGMRWLTICLPNQKNFEIVLYNPSGWMENPESRDTALAQIGKQAQLILGTDDIDGLYKRLQEHGSEIVREINQMPWGRDLTFRDLYGDSVYVVEPPKA